MPRTYLADRLDKGTTNPELPECGRYADVVKVDHRVRVAQRCLRPPDDLRIDIAGWLRADPREKQNVFGLGKQLTDSRWRKALRSGRLKQPRQRRGVHALHLAIESRDGFSVRFSCWRDHNFHGHELARLSLPILSWHELSQAAVLVEEMSFYARSWEQSEATAIGTQFSDCRARKLRLDREGVPSGACRMRYSASLRALTTST
jgi:hypothetical protein